MHNKKMTSKFLKTRQDKYDAVQRSFNNNQTSDFSEWLKFETIFGKLGKQGITGILKLISKDEKDKGRVVFKISQYINYLARHENEILNGLNELQSYSIHFCKGIGYLNCKVEPRYKKKSNPFEISSKYPIQKDVLLCEYIDKSKKFGHYIDDLTISENVIYSSIKQVLMAISIAQRDKKFTHYDLHSFNIMMKDCDEDDVFLYVLDDENQIYIPTYGKYPVIIDFGFSFIENMNDSPLWATLAHTDVGFMSDRFDWVADPKLFLVTLSSELRQRRKNVNSKNFRNIVRNIFGPLNIDWSSGWDKTEKKGASDYVTELLKECNDNIEHKSILFNEYPHFCIDLLQSLIILPLQKQTITDFNKSCKAFLKEWIKIENEITSSFYNLYVLQGIVDSAREVRPIYMNTTTKDLALKNFKSSIYSRLNEITKYCNPKNVNFEILLCSLLLLGKNIEGILYEIISTQMEIKQKEYDKLPLQSIEQIFGAIEVNFPSSYQFNEKTTVHVFDSINKTKFSYKPNRSQLSTINQQTSFTKGNLLYQLFCSSSKS
jgi:hypothetical protein